jgi:ketosteroid isomerase-like protein
VLPPNANRRDRCRLPPSTDEIGETGPVIHEGVRQSWEQWLENWDEYQAEVERVTDCGDDVLVVARERRRGKTSGASVSSRSYMVFIIRAVKIARYREFYDEQAALNAVGLSG